MLGGQLVDDICATSELSGLLGSSGLAHENYVIY